MPRKSKSKNRSQKTQQLQVIVRPPQPRAKSKKVRRKSKQARNSMMLPECTRHYLQALSKPFDPASLGACVPSMPSRPTIKTATWGTGTFAVGAAGFGFLLVSPTVCNDTPMLWATNASFSGTSATFTVNNTAGTSTTGVIPVMFANSIFDVGDILPTGTGFGQTTSSRIVAVGIECTCTTPIMNVGGTITALVHPDHRNLYGCTSSSLTGFTGSCSKRIDTKPVRICVGAVSEFERQFSDTSAAGSAGEERISFAYPFSRTEWLESLSQTNSWNNGAAPIAICIDGVPGLSYMYRIIVHYEITGTSGQTLATPNHLTTRDDTLSSFVANQLGAVQAAALQMFGDATRGSLRLAGQVLMQRGVQALGSMSRGAMSSTAQANGVLLDL
jgi:hypothetical protein